jgi:hypothetical protein
MVISPHIPTYNNPYESFVQRQGDSPLGPVSRFKSDVRLPMPGEFVTSDPLAPMRRFRQDVQPPRFSPINLQTGDPVHSGRKNWDVSPVRNSFAIESYRSAFAAPSMPAFIDARR